MPETPITTGSEALVTFTDMAYGGDAVGRLGDNGMAVFASFGIEGEWARVRISQVRANLAKGVIEQVVEPSPLRVEPACRFFGRCGGCQWQHIEYSGQSQFKHHILRGHLSRIAGISDPDSVLKPPLASPSVYNYRNTSHFAVHAAERSLGYFMHNSHHVISVDQCPISNAGINTSIPIVNGLLSESPEEAFLRDETRGIMRVWQVTIRHSEATGHTLVVFHTRAGGASKPRRTSTRRRSREQDGPDSGSNADIPLMRRQVRKAISSLYRTEIDSKPLALTVVEVMEDGTVNMLGATRAAAGLASDAAADALAGSFLRGDGAHTSVSESGPPLGAWVETLGGRHYWVAPEAFFQVNTFAAELILEEVMSHVPRKLALMVDAHTGVGAFALSASEHAKSVLAFETNSGAIASGRWTAAVSGVSNVEFRHGKAEALLPRLHKDEQPDLILLDPPRSGCNPPLLDEILKRQIPRIIYVSCDPSTLARDIKALTKGYTLTSSRVVDMFPQTYHLETVAVLDRSS